MIDRIEIKTSMSAQTVEDEVNNFIADKKKPTEELKFELKDLQFSGSFNGGSAVYSVMIRYTLNKRNIQ